MVKKDKKNNKKKLKIKKNKKKLKIKKNKKKQKKEKRGGLFYSPNRCKSSRSIGSKF